MTPQNQTFQSIKQFALIGSSNNEKIFNELRTIIIKDNSFVVELPDGSKLTGTLTYRSEYGDYLTDAGCPFSISENEIGINLYKTHDALYCFYRASEEEITALKNYEKLKWWQKFFK